MSYSINQTFIIEPVDMFDTLSACTSLYTNNLYSCSGNTQILLGTDIISFNRNVYTSDNISGDTIYGSVFSSGGTNIINIINDVSITGASFTSSAQTLTISTGNRSEIIVTGFTQIYTTGATYDNSDGFLGLTNNAGATIYVGGFFTSANDIHTTGGTYSNGVLILTDSSGNTLTITGLTTPFSGGTIAGDTSFLGNISATTVQTTTLKVLGSVSTNVVSQTTNYAANVNDYSIIMSGSELTLTLPSASSTFGKIYSIVNIFSGSLLVTGYNDYTSTNQTSIGGHSGLRIQSNGSIWQQIP